MTEVSFKGLSVNFMLTSPVNFEDVLSMNSTRALDNHEIRRRHLRGPRVRLVS